MSLTVRILIGLVAGLVVGAVLGAQQAPAQLATAAEVIGGIWLDALRMTIVPLVFALLVTSTATITATAKRGGVVGRALLWFAILIAGGAVFGALVTPPLLALSPISAADAAALRAANATASAAIPAIPPTNEWLRNIIPSNPVRAAADGAVLPLVVFALFFGFATARIAADLRDRIVGFFQAISEAMLIIVHWVLWAGPLGVFALALLVGLRVGVGAFAALAHYILIVSAVCVLLMAALYALVALNGISLRRFQRAASPALAVGLTTQSSLATLPAMIEGTQQQLGIPAHVAGLVLPMAVSLLRVTSPAANLAVVLYVASLYGIDIGTGQMLAGIAIAAVLSLALVSLPSQITFFTALVPISLAMGVPIEVLPLLLAVETAPDIFRTLGNVTADLAVTAIVARQAT